MLSGPFPSTSTSPVWNKTTPGFEAWGKHLWSSSLVDPLHLLVSGALVIPSMIEVYPDLCWCLCSTYLEVNMTLSELNAKTSSDLKYHCQPHICLTQSYICVGKEKKTWVSVDSSSPVTAHKPHGIQEGFLVRTVGQKRWLPAARNWENSQAGWWQESGLHRETICVEGAEGLLGQHKISLALGTFHDFFSCRLEM